MSARGLLAPHRLWRLVSGDAINIARDPMLLFATALSFAPALALYLGEASMNAAADAALGIDSLSRYVLPVALLVPASLLGWVTGFLLLEDRDEGTLLALDVTTVGKSGFLAYRIAVTAALAVVITLYAWPLVMRDKPPELVLSIAALVAMNAIAFAVLLPAIARNKVEGLALTKLTNLLVLAPLLAAIPSPLRYAGGIIPSYWVGELLALTEVAPLTLWIALPIALAVNLAAVVALFRLFARRTG